MPVIQLQGGTTYFDWRGDLGIKGGGVKGFCPTKILMEEPSLIKQSSCFFQTIIFIMSYILDSNNLSTCSTWPLSLYNFLHIHYQFIPLCVQTLKLVVNESFLFTNL